MLHNVCRYMYNRAFLCVLVYCTWLSIYVGVSTICVHNTMSFRYVSGVFVHMRVHFLSEAPLLLSCGPLQLSAGLTWASQTLSPRHRCCAERGFAALSGLSRPCGHVCPAASSRWHCPCWLCPSPAAWLCRQYGPLWQSSSPLHTPAARSSLDRPQCPRS